MKYFLSSIVLIASFITFVNFRAKNVSIEPDIEATYQQYCAQCHGSDLTGGNAQSMVDGVWQFGDSRNYIFRNIKFGIPHLGMPSFEASLSDKQINGLVQYIQNEELRKGVQKPALENQLETLEYLMKVEVFAKGLTIPWAIDFLDNNTALITERPGNLRVVKNGILQENPVENTPRVLHEGQGGLLDVAVDPNYKNNGWIYLAYSHEIESSENARRAPAMTRIVRGKIVNNTWVNQEVLFEADHDMYRTTRQHYGCRIVFDPDGYLYFGIGDRGAKEQAQELARPNGKIHRIRTNGSIPEDNPFYSQKSALSTIFAYGNRNPQGLAVHPVTGEVWETEHGPMGGDELNLIKPGVNYGWPVITYGKNYNGTVLSEFTSKKGMQQPNLYWNPSIAVCGLDFYHGEEFPKWENRLLVGALKYEEVRLLNIEGDRVIHEQVILKNAGRVRDVSTGPDGAIYVVLNKPDEVIRLTKLSER